MRDNPTSDLLIHQPFPELGAALRSRIDRIIEIWLVEVRKMLSVTADLSREELMDSLPTILPRMADALEAADAEETQRLAEISPQQGLTRFRQSYSMPELLLEDRLLRRIVVTEIHKAMGRSMIPAEHIALHMAFDEMVQWAVLAFGERQQERIRQGAESQLKYLAFLSHDMNNNLNHVTLALQVMRHRLASLPHFADEVNDLDAIQQSILATVGGMGRLLQAERLRKTGIVPTRRTVNLQHLAAMLAQQATSRAAKPALRIAVDVPPDATLNSDEELIMLILQNLLGNAIKYSTKGVVRISADRAASGGWTLCVSDEGPGIDKEHLAGLFEAFRRGEAHGQPGVGLGLAIAAEAAKHLGATLAVESEVGKGSRFTLTLPPDAVTN